LLEFDWLARCAMGDSDEQVQLLSDDEGAQRNAGASRSPPPAPRHKTTLREEGITWPVVLIGLFIGLLLTFSNMYFGLQTGWVTMGSLQSALLGYGICRLFKVSPFGVQENVMLQTVAVATATMPLAGGFVSIIPALEQLATPVNMDLLELFLWTMGVAFFGVFFAVPLRKEVILREKLAFPSGTATAEMIAVLNRTSLANPVATEDIDGEELDEIVGAAKNKRRWKILGQTFAISAFYEFAGYFVPIIKRIPVFGTGTAVNWGWLLVPSASYMGQGMIMGFRVALSQMAGALCGWVILGPVVNSQGWVDGTVMDDKEGVKGWLTWLALAIIFAESMVSLGLLIHELVQLWLSKNDYHPWLWIKARVTGTSSARSSSYLLHGSTATSSARSRRARQQETSIDARYATFANPPQAVDNDVEPVLQAASKTPLPSSHEHADEEDYALPHQQVSSTIWVPGLIITAASCAVISSLVFHLDFYEPLLAVFASILVSVIAIRALGQTDINPVSGVGKLSQLLFAGIAPGNVASNIIAGGIAEAGAQQAGDMMQDLKTGYLHRSSPRAQFFAQMVGAFFSVFFAIAAWKLYNNAYEIPGPEFSVPSAALWLDMALLLSGESDYFPRNITPFCVVAGLLAGSLPLLEKFKPRLKPYLPSAVAFGIGLYLVPYWTIPRFLGSLAQFFWQRYYPASHDRNMLVVASGLVLGEGIMSIITALFTSFDVPYATCGGCNESLCPSRCFDD
jgi:OPT family oligopeptide transporter